MLVTASGKSSSQLGDASEIVSNVCWNAISLKRIAQYVISLPLTRDVLGVSRNLIFAKTCAETSMPAVMETMQHQCLISMFPMYNQNNKKRMQH